jgi:hypothetical protein
MARLAAGSTRSRMNPERTSQGLVCKSAKGPSAHRRTKYPIYLMTTGSKLAAYSHAAASEPAKARCDGRNAASSAA